MVVRALVALHDFARETTELLLPCMMMTGVRTGFVREDVVFSSSLELLAGSRHELPQVLQPVR